MQGATGLNQGKRLGWRPSQVPRRAYDAANPSILKCHLTSSHPPSIEPTHKYSLSLNTHLRSRPLPRAVGAGKPSCESEAAKAQVADWLASYAIGMEYSDKADKLCKVQTQQKPAHVASPQVQPKADNKPAGVDVEMNVDSPEFQEALHKLADLLKVPRDDSPEAMLRQVHLS